MAEEKKKYKLSSILRQLANEKRTGTLICIGEDNIQGRIYFREGRPVSAISRNLQGSKALTRINQKLLVALKFHKDSNLVTLKDRADIRKTPRLDEPLTEQVSEDEFNTLVDISSLTLDGDDRALDVPLSAELKEMVIEELTEHLGPVAMMFVSELEDNIDLKTALNRLAREIGDVDAGIEFVQNVRDRL